jgi:hypothetical protein
MFGYDWPRQKDIERKLLISLIVYLASEYDIFVNFKAKMLPKPTAKFMDSKVSFTPLFKKIFVMIGYLEFS